VSKVDLPTVQSRRQLVATELRIVSRTWNRPRVDNVLDLNRTEFVGGQVI